MLFFDLRFRFNNALFTLLAILLLAACSSSKKTVTSTSKRATGTRNASPTERKARNTEIVTVEEEKELPPVETKEDAATKRVQKVISTARTFIGTPYKYGGTTRSGMDCSALLINSFSAVKLNLPRSSEAQSKVGIEVRLDELKPGDLVFFATGNKKKEITHVGLITDVRGKDNVKFIHASSSLGVVETNLFAEYYQKRFRVARRVID
jgi:cell wall-associated NlpC family hydrolase